MIPNYLDSKIFGRVDGITTTTTINRVNTMTPRQNDLVVKNEKYLFKFFLISENDHVSR